MSRLVAFFIVSLLPGTPVATASCLVACSLRSTTNAVGTCHEEGMSHFDSAVVVAGESGCEWVVGAPYVREDRCPPRLLVKAPGVPHVAQFAALEVKVSSRALFGPSRGRLTAAGVPQVLRL